jgi:hypothetical protein
VLLFQPSRNGPPDVVVQGVEDVLRSPRMTVEVTLTPQDSVDSIQTITERPMPRMRLE